ncbi:M56 family metallopeptidase [Sphingomonas sp.]|uniref:M56 family metallopeptidase n=1 Tax=Sphingomonas sp. TaxID=28214 RepID=UPI001EB2D0F9|nr:M56 family metallopeptidase [Sphingomonas sp.]MBX3593821.1 hypothetical protein [Sphingomonas sp.]
MIAWLVETFVATTLLMLVVLLVRRPVARQFGPNIAYALWLLPVIRMVMPPLPGTWRFTDLIAPLARSAQNGEGVMFGILNTDTIPQSAVDTAIFQAQVELAGRTAHLAAVPPTPVADGPSVALLLAALWGIGALAFLAYHLIAHRCFCARLLHRARVERTVAEGRVRVIETDAATGPLAFGIWRKYVAFPRDFSERYDPLERNLALAHELGHHLRGDLIANWIALVALALHWFNPVAWRAFRAFRADQELACDALVLAGRAPALRHAYGRAIVKSAHGGAVSAACHLHTINELKGRLKMLSKHNHKSRLRLTAGIAGATVLTLAGLALTASGTQAAAAGDDVSRIQAPAAPEAPAAPRAPMAAPAPRAPIAAVAPGQPVAPVAPVAPAAPPASKKSERRVVIVEKKDGKEITRIVGTAKGGDPMSWSEGADPAASVDVRSGKCGAPKDGQLKIERMDGQTRRIVICEDRIEARAAVATERAMSAERRAMAIAPRAEAMAVASAKLGKRQALMGLKLARRSIEAQDTLSAAQKAKALTGIDEAIRELQAEQD